jgi:hypothetical protein
MNYPSPTTDFPGATTCNGGQGSALRQEVCRQAAAACTAGQRHGLRALVLTGSLARDEGTWTTSGAAWKAHGDAEFLLIFENDAVLPARTAVKLMERQVEESLRSRQILCRVELTPVRTAYLRKLQPAIFAYELCTCGRVVWGDRDVLGFIRPFAAADIPWEDAWRLLCNRMIECLEVATDRSAAPSLLAESLGYRVVKLYLDMATSLLVFAGGYDPSYRKRAGSVRALAENADSASEFPFALDDFAQCVNLCTTLKIGFQGAGPKASEAKPSEIPEGMLVDAVQHAHQLWRWELTRLAETRSGNLTDQDLIYGWSRLQSTGGRIRGWVVALRACGWLRSWKNWPRWAYYAWRISPRHLVYRVGSELFFRLPDLRANSGGGDCDWASLRALLPLRLGRDASSSNAGWSQLAQEVAFNYRQLLERTRA